MRRDYDRANDRLRITTLEGYEITFDLTTGFVLSQYYVGTALPVMTEDAQTSASQTNDAGIIIALAVLGAAAFVAVKVARKRKLN